MLPGSSQKIYGLYARKHHIVEMRGDVTDAGRRTTNEQLKIELLSQWKLEAEFRNMNVMYPSQGLGACNEGGGEEEEARGKGDQGWAVNWRHLQLGFFQRHLTTW